MRNFFRLLLISFWVGSWAGAAESQTALLGPSVSTPWYVSAGTGVGLLGGNAGLGVGVQALRGPDLDTPVAMGLELSVYRWDLGAESDPLRSFGFASSATATTLVTLLPTFLWDFPVGGWARWVPYLGLSAGPAVYFASGRSPVGDLAHANTIGLALFLRPGIRARLGSQVSVVAESKVGLFRGAWLLLPQFSVAWTL